MARYLVGRVFGLIIVFVVVSMLAFLMMHSVPGGPFDEEKQPLPPAGKANILHKYGLDKPLYVQYLLYMGSALHGDFGISFQSPTQTVTELIGQHMAHQYPAWRNGDSAGVQYRLDRRDHRGGQAEHLD